MQTITINRKQYRVEVEGGQYMLYGTRNAVYGLIPLAGYDNLYWLANAYTFKDMAPTMRFMVKDGLVVEAN